MKRARIYHRGRDVWATVVEDGTALRLPGGGIVAVSDAQWLPPVQRGAAVYALGLNYWQSMRLIVLPQAFRNMLPILLTQTIVLFQDVSLVSLLNVTDFVGAAGKIAQRDGRVVEMYLFVAVVYFIICFALSWLVKRLQKKIAIIR